MPTIVHFIDVGQGNMVLIEAASGRCFVFDCNITNDNEERVLDYVAEQIGEGKHLHAFICSHRDADHMRGVKKLHARFPIGKIWDSGYPGTTTDSSEYTAYMDLRRSLGNRVIDKCTYNDFGRTRLRFLSAKDDRLASNANAQGIVIKVEQRNDAMDRIEGSAMLPGDSDAETWRSGILADYNKPDISSNILLAAHHGSNSFFDDPNLTYYYKDHLAAIKPAMTIVSVGPNSHGHPKDTAMKYYREYSTGSDAGNKVYRTDTKPFGVMIAIACIVAFGFEFDWSVEHGLGTDPLIIGATGVSACILVWWTFAVKDNWVREAGDAYAHALLSAIDGIE